MIFWYLYPNNPMAEPLQDTVSGLTAFIEQNYTDVETGPGSVISELLVKLAAAVQNEQYNTMESLSQGNSITAALASAADTYSPIIDAVASNYSASRKGGVKVTGKLKVTLSSPNEFSFRAGFAFLQPALNLKYLLARNVRVSANPSAALQETQLYSDQGFYYFLVDVVAENVGAEYQVSSGTTFSVPAPGVIGSLVKAEAYGNFTSGSSIETDKQLIARAKDAIGTTALVSANGIANRFAIEFPGFQSLSVCGSNDPEMVRSKQNVLGIATFGKADVYVRTSLGLEFANITKAATKLTATTWELLLGNSEVPGFYTVRSIVPHVTDVSLGGTLVVTSTDFGFAGYADQRINELPSIADARFSKYQTALVCFTYDDNQATAVGDTAQFDLQLSYQPFIQEMQDLMLLDNTRLACADYLVKAVIPCMVSLNIGLIKKRTSDTYESLNLKGLKKDIFTYVNSIPFGEQLQASNIVDICHNYSIKRVDLPLAMEGTILCPDGTSLYLSDADVLAIPTNIAKGVSPNTTQYFIDYYRVVDGVAQPIDNIGLSIA